MLVALLTGLHHPDYPADVAGPGPIQNFEATNVEIPLNGQRSGSITFPMDSPWGQQVYPYERAVVVCYTPTTIDDFPLTPIIWGKCVKPVFDDETQKVTMPLVDPGAHMEHHFLRYGDQAIGRAPGNPWHRQVPVDWQGILMLIDAARNIPNQNTRNCPDIGVYARADYSDTADTLDAATKLKMKFGRGDEVWQSVEDLTEHDIGPDIVLRPTLDRMDERAYVELEIFDRLGVDTGVRFESGTARNNATVSFSPGGKLITHDHVLSQDGKKRVTAVDTGSSATYGVYVSWDVTNYKATDTPILKAFGKEQIKKYGKPPLFNVIKPNPDCNFKFLRDYDVGDTVTAVQRTPNKTWQTPARILKVTVQQSDANGNDEVLLDVAPDLGSASIVGD